MLEIEVVGDKQVVETLQRLAGRLQNQRAQLLGLVDQLLAAEQIRFRDGTGWPALSPATIRRDQTGGRNPKPMRVTGRLAASLTRRGAPGQLVQVTPDTLRFGTSLHYAWYHQRGEGVPRRTVVDLSRSERAQIVKSLRRLLLEDL